MSKKIAIVNRSPKDYKWLPETFVLKIINEIISESTQISYFNLNEKEIKSCIGCWDCWWKTPGLCRHADDANEILKAIINSDLVIYVSPLLLGMYSAMLKKFHDRTIPLIHPYVEIRNKEVHHKKDIQNIRKWVLLSMKMTLLQMKLKT